MLQLSDQQIGAYVVLSLIVFGLLICFFYLLYKLVLYLMK